MAITAVQFVKFPVADLERSMDFYIGALGFRVLIDDMSPFGRYVVVAPRDSDTGIALVHFDVRPDGGRGHPGNIQILSDDVDADVECLRSIGVAVSGPTTTPWGHMAILADPDGNAISVLQRQASDSISS
ncbi:MAG: VOC family protein [Kutzneria sp.]|nr:VOC family protein [Kutzneria sp.]